jgi:hypothetical protein
MKERFAQRDSGWLEFVTSYLCDRKNLKDQGDLPDAHLNSWKRVASS